MVWGMSRENLLDKVTSRAEERMKGLPWRTCSSVGDLGFIPGQGTRSTWRKQKSSWDAAKKMLQWQQRPKVLCAVTKIRCSQIIKRWKENEGLPLQVSWWLWDLGLHLPPMKMKEEGASPMRLVNDNRWEGALFTREPLYKFKVFCLPVLAVLNLHCVSGEALINVRKARIAANEEEGLGKAVYRNKDSALAKCWDISFERHPKKQRNRYTLFPPSTLKVCIGTHQSWGFGETARWHLRPAPGGHLFTCCYWQNMRYQKKPYLFSLILTGPFCI